MKLKFISILLVSATLLSAGSNYSKAYKTCMNKSGGVTLKMRTCNGNEIKHQDKKLNTNYKKAMKVLSKEKKTELKKVQREWMKYRDMKCGFEGSMTGGSMDLLMGGDCLLDMTAVRAKELGSISAIL